MPSKTCSKCKVEKPIDKFSKRKNYRYGVSCRCKDCDVVVSKETYARHAEAYRAHNREYNRKNRARLNEKNKAWQRANPEKVRLYQKRSIERNPNRLVNNRLKSEYGISLKDYERMYLEQSGVCLICDNPCKLGKLCVDHDHETKKVRGLLCRKCNTAIGLLGDKVKLVQRAVTYLKKYE